MDDRVVISRKTSYLRTEYKTKETSLTIEYNIAMPDNVAIMMYDHTTDNVIDLNVSLTTLADIIHTFQQVYIFGSDVS